MENNMIFFVKKNIRIEYPDNNKVYYRVVNFFCNIFSAKPNQLNMTKKFDQHFLKVFNNIKMGNNMIFFAKKK